MPRGESVSVQSAEGFDVERNVVLAERGIESRDRPTGVDRHDLKAKVAVEVCGADDVGRCCVDISGKNGGRNLRTVDRCRDGSDVLVDCGGGHIEAVTDNEVDAAICDHTLDAVTDGDGRAGAAIRIVGEGGALRVGQSE